MCVIVANNRGQTPSIADLREMQRSNPDGIGLAWRSAEDHAIRFEKGISFERMLQILMFIENRKIPYVLHFRITTIGGQGEKFCHPWPITTDFDAIFALNGTAQSVLCHNGTWSEWYTAIPSIPMLKTMVKQDWSDSAAMALLLMKDKRTGLPLQKAMHSLEIGKWGQRICVLSYNRGLQFYGGFELHGGIYYSNMYWSSDSKYWNRWWGDDEGHHLAAPPAKVNEYAKYANYTACDLESARRMGRISKRRYKRLKRRLARSANGNIVVYPSSATSNANDVESENGTHFSYNVWCENCGAKFPYSTLNCPKCLQGDGVYTHSSDPTKFLSLHCDKQLHEGCRYDSICVCQCHSMKAHTSNLAMDTSMACEDKRHDDCLWKTCQCWCHNCCIHGKPIDDMCSGCLTGDLKNIQPLERVSRQMQSERSKKPRYLIDAITHVPACQCDKCTAIKQDKSLASATVRRDVLSKPPMVHILGNGETHYCIHNCTLDRPCSQCEAELAKDNTKWPSVVSQPRRD